MGLKEDTPKINSRFLGSIKLKTKQLDLLPQDPHPSEEPEETVHKGAIMRCLLLFLIFLEQLTSNYLVTLLIGPRMGVITS